jgi:putative DNA primase/helicase
MIAVEIARALGSACRSGTWWRCRCPAHASRGPTLALRDGGHGLIVKCFAGCNPLDVLTELRRHGLIGGQGGYRSIPAAALPADTREDVSRRIAMAHRLWEAGQDARGSPVERYLRSRGIEIPLPPCLRWAPACQHPNARLLPAMLARIENVGGELIGVHRTYLRSDGSGKSDVEPGRAMLGRVAGGAVRLAPAADELLVGEGIETVGAAMTATGLPGWAALSANGLERLILPPVAKMVVICVDHDASGVGKRAAQNAAQRWLAEGRCVRPVIPQDIDTDMADVLIASERLGGVAA